VRRWRVILWVVVVTAVVLGGVDVFAQEYGIDSRASNTTLLIPDLPPNSSFPEFLSDIPALLDAGLGIDQTDAGIIPYAPSAKLWSDGALKDRFMAIPGLGQITYEAEGGWTFPDETVLIKNFILPQDFRDPFNTGKRIETRLLIRSGSGWAGFSYEWNELETDAELLSGSKTRNFDLIDENGNPFNYDWYYPSQSDCNQCHTTQTNKVAGITTAQLNSPYRYPESGRWDNQLRTLEHIGMFDAALPASPEELPSAPNPANPNATTVDRAEAYLLANCAVCHQPGGINPTSIDFRWGLALGDRDIFNVDATEEGFGLPDPKRLDPGDPFNSVIHLRMSTLGEHRMPPLGTSRVDADGDDLVRAWITLMTTETGPDAVWVDFAAVAPEFGTLDDPFATVAKGLQNVSSGGTINLIPGDTSATITIDSPVTLASTGGPVRIGVL